MPKRLEAKIKHYNRLLPLADYLIPLVGDKKEVVIADIGSGPFPITGQLLDGVKVTIYHCDRRDQSVFWQKHETTPLFPIEYQNMEELTYEDNFFDIVHCVNALDHTLNAKAAVRELIRVCKPGGSVYIDCYLIQHSTSGKLHAWDAEQDGTFTSKDDKFDLKDFGFSIKFIDNHGEKRYNHIIAIYKK